MPRRSSEKIDSSKRLGAARADAGGEMTPDPPPYGLIALGIIRGRLTPFLGAGVNLFGRARGEWRIGDNRFPDGSELAGYLAQTFEFEDHRSDLLRVSQYVVLRAGADPLYEELHDIFSCACAPNDVHRFLAEIPELMRVQGLPPSYQLVVTTNYDSSLETAFHDAGEEVDLFYYRSEKDRRGRFWHRHPDGTDEPVDNPNEHEPELLEHRTAILKIHGDVHPEDPTRDSYVITEDDYIDYLAHTDISDLLPKTLKARMTRSHFLFLGYSLRDWNLRAFLHKLWSERKLGSQSWAIQLKPDQLEQELWGNRGVRIHNVRLEDFMEPFRKTLEERLWAAAARTSAATPAK